MESELTPYASTESGVLRGGLNPSDRNGQSSVARIKFRTGDCLPVRLGRLRAIALSFAGTRDDVKKPPDRKTWRHFVRRLMVFWVTYSHQAPQAKGNNFIVLNF